MKCEGEQGWIQASECTKRGVFKKLYLNPGMYISDDVDFEMLELEHLN